MSTRTAEGEQVDAARAIAVELEELALDQWVVLADPKPGVVVDRARVPVAPIAVVEAARKAAQLASAVLALGQHAAPIPMLLFCPRCGTQHVDAPEPENGWTNPPHTSHMCHNPACKAIWRPADVATTGVAAIATRGERDTFPLKHEVAEEAGQGADERCAVCSLPARDHSGSCPGAHAFVTRSQRASVEA